MASIPLTLKVKSHKKTVYVLLDGSSKVSDVLDVVASKLNAAIEACEDTDLIDIPKPSFELTETETGAPKEDIISHDSKVSAEDLRLAVPENKNDLSKGWRDITEETDSLSALGIKDLAILAYKYNNEAEFEVEIPLDTE